MNERSPLSRRFRPVYSPTYEFARRAKLKLESGLFYRLIRVIERAKAIIQSGLTEPPSGWTIFHIQGDRMQVTDRQKPASQYHNNIKPLGYFYKTKLTNELMDACGAYLETLNDGQRIGLFYLVGAMLGDRLKRTHYTSKSTGKSMPLVADEALFGLVPQNIGIILEKMSGAELVGVIHCLMENTHSSLWSGCDEAKP